VSTGAEFSPGNAGFRAPVDFSLLRLGRSPEGSLYVVANGAHRTDHPDGDDDMKVSELIELLEEQDPDAEVLVMMQQNWPFECSLAGVTTREEMLRADRDEDGDGDEDEEPRLERGTAKNDVFLVEGEQLRYGSKTAWSVATR
jgi:hypothetical protein